MKIVASAHVGHTGVRLPTTGARAFHRLPIGLQWFSDGLAVTAAIEPYREALGLHVTRIGALTPEQLESAVATYIAYERESSLRVQSQTYMLVEEVLRATGQVDADGRVALTLAQTDGSPLTLRVAAIPWSERPQMISVTTSRNLTPGAAQRDSSRYYRWEILAGTKTLYVRYSRCQDDPQQPFAAFVQELFAKVDENPAAVDRVIVDLRANGGGNSRVINPLLDGLRARKPLSKRGHLYALTGPATFSSGLLAAWYLKRMDAILVGEAPGENLNSYSEVRELTLPHSGVAIQYATKFNKLGKDGQGLEPDVRVTRSLGDFLTGRDPVLDAAMRR
jgi:C-terminal processing protease CtpA/Prc